MGKPRDCGCIEEDNNDAFYIVIEQWCKPHEIQVGYFLWLHWGGGHEWCCDLPGFRLALDHFSEEDIREAASTVLKEGQQKYVDKLLSMV